MTMSGSEKWTSVRMKLLTAGTHVPASASFDYTKLSAINTCPTWGIIRYGHHKHWPGGGRALALEAGGLLHECFSVVRLAQLWRAQGYVDHARWQLVRMFGKERGEGIASVIGNPSADTTKAARDAALCALETGNWVDDPYDKRRTYVNMENALLLYCQRWEHSRYPVWVQDDDDPTSLVGVEVPFVIELQVASANSLLQRYYYTGRVDGIHWSGTDKQHLIVHENKTGSRLEDAWRQSFDVSHQVTGYMQAARLMTGRPVSRALVYGLALPLPKALHQGYVVADVRRDEHMFAQWMQWIEHTINVYHAHFDNPHEAPRYTHSCNRYFRPCSLIPFCASDQHDREAMLGEMVTDEWSPLQDKAGD